MQEINDFIVHNLFLSIFGKQNVELNKEEQEFQTKYDNLAERVKPADFKINESLMNETNQPVWQKAIKELQKFGIFSTPRLKLKHLMMSLMIVNNIFSLFQKDAEDMGASADDILTIFPYIVLKAKIPKLLRHIQFIRLFEFKELLAGEKNFVLSKLEISVELIKNFEFHE